MPITGNKRVTQLVELTSNEVIPEDLLYIVDVNANESKRIKASEFGLWLKSSGSFYAIRALLADTASYILGSNIDGLVNSSSYALSSSVSSLTQISSQSLNAISSSYALTASFALNSNSSGSDTASYLLYQGVPNGTASYALNAFSADSSTVTSFLQYFGGNNGTASFAITTQNVQHATVSDTASYFNNVIGYVATSSYSFLSEQSNVATVASSSNYLIFSPNNGTASYAMAAKSFANQITNYGIFLATTQSNNMSQLDDIDVLWSTNSPAETQIEAAGTLIIPFTSSIPTNETIYLSLIERNTGIQTLLDSTPVSINLSPTMGDWGNYNSGTIEMPFSLIDQINLYGSYMVFVSSSNNIQIEPSRLVKFKVSSKSDVFNEYVNESLIFNVSPNTTMFTYTTNVGGPYTTNLTTLLTTPPSDIYTLNVTNQIVSSIRYLWTFSNLTASNFSNNPLLSYISGVPNSLTYLSCSNCHLSSFYSFASSSLSVFDCHNNIVGSLPNFPLSMSCLNCANNNITSLNLPVTLSYLNCSDNNIITLPINLPYELNYFFADNNDIQILPILLPNTIVSMSLNNNTSLSNFSYTTPLPTQLKYLSLNNCPINNLPTIPTNVLYLSLQSCSLYSLSMDNITSNLISNNMIGGIIDIRGNGIPSSTTLSNLSILNQSPRNWTIFYDL